MLAQIVVNGLLSGLTLAVVALAFSLVYLPCRVFHVALGGLFAVAPYVMLAMLRRGGPWEMSGVIALAAVIAASVACEVANHRWLERRQASSGAHLVASLAIYVIIVQTIAIAWGSETQLLRREIDQTYRIANLILTSGQIVAGAVSAALLTLSYGWLRFTRLGLRLRAMADNRVEFELLGYNIAAHRTLAFAMSGLLAGIAALVVANDVGFDPYGGLRMLLLAVVAVIIGGRSSYLGPVAGGVVLGTVRSQVAWLLSPSWQDLATFLLLALFLYVRPDGLFSRQGRLEAEP